jgi:hypothetical protein
VCAPDGVSDPGVIACYAPGTLIATRAGPRWIEALMPGDTVLTADHGSQPIRSVTRFRQSLTGLPDAALPVLIRRGALGPDLPARDLVVSARHRMLVSGHGQLAAFFGTEVFVPATALTGLPGIRVVRGRQAIIWHHFACARHEVVLAQGCRSESLLPGPDVSRILQAGPRRRADRVLHDPGCAAPLDGRPARPCLTVSEARDRFNRGRLRPAA